MADRLDISGRDVDTLTPIEKLAHAYPDVYALMQERDALRARDKPAKAVLQAWRERIAPARTQRMEDLVRLFIGNALADRLDALARAHEDATINARLNDAAAAPGSR